MKATSRKSRKFKARSENMLELHVIWKVQRAYHLLYCVLKYALRFLFLNSRGPEYYTIEIHVDYDIIFIALDALSKPDYLLLTMANHTLSFSISCFVL